MEPSAKARFGVCAVCAGALLTGCGGNAGVGVSSNVNAILDREPNPLSYRVLHSFGGGHDGRAPNDLISVGDRFYGTTQLGGINHCTTNDGGCGTIFSITADGKEQVLHDFGNGKDGNDPVADLIDVDDTLYGATTLGGAHGYGTLFSVTPGGKEKVLYSFGAKPDGAYPNGDLIDVGGTFYGTATGGGKGCGFEGCGIVFSITKDGRERVLHYFDNTNFSDGWYPNAGLVYAGGTFYGTTYQGGYYDWGTFFSITRNGKEKVLHSFGRGNDGWYPSAVLIDVEGTLYGTTEGGGAGHCGRGYGGCGTVFGITRVGKERLLHSFNGIDGSFPEAGLVSIGGTLYGTTRNGGNRCSPSYGSCGTVFSITRGGEEQVLRRFLKGSDGWFPLVRLTYKSGSFFGTTRFGGRHNGGVIFSLRP